MRALAPQIVDHIENPTQEERGFGILASAWGIPGVLYSQCPRINFCENQMALGAWPCVDGPEPMLIHSQVNVDGGRVLVGWCSACPSWEQHSIFHSPLLQIIFDDLISSPLVMKKKKTFVDHLA